LASNGNSYTRAVGNGGLDASDADELFAYLQQFTYVEGAHRDYLKAAIPMFGGTPVTANPAGYKFTMTPASDIASIMAAILPLEETGVRAYLGALPYITDLSIAQAAATIFSTEARHSGVISYRLGFDTGPRLMNGDKRVTPVYPAQNTFEYYLDPKTVLTKASAYFA
jgi:hypothetical protein